RTPSSQRAVQPSLSPQKRVERIRELLKQLPGDSVDGLPPGLLKTITDQSHLLLLEEKLTTHAPFVEAANAINAIGLLADWSWDHRQIKSQGSIAKLTAFYERTGDGRLRSMIMDTLFKFDGPEIPFDFILDRLAEDPVPLKATMLANLQFFVDKPYLSDLIKTRLLPLLHNF